jgi:DNA-binding XRE family transcriptional regulator
VKGHQSELKELRKMIHGKMSQQCFAELIGVSRDTIAAIERGAAKITENVARRIRSATGCLIFGEKRPTLAPNYPNLPLRDFANRPYTRESYDEWSLWRKSLTPSNALYRSRFFTIALLLLTNALLKKDSSNTNKKNAELILFWMKLSELFGEYLKDFSVAKCVEGEIARLFPGDRENLMTFIRCLHGTSLPVEGEFKGLRKCYKERNIAQNYVESIIANAAYSMHLFRKWTRCKLIIGENTSSEEELDTKKDFERICNGLLHALKYSDMPREEKNQLLAGIVFPEGYVPF